MPDIHELLFHLVGGLIGLSVLNLVLEVIGISVLGGESKPNFVVRLLIVLVAGFGLGYGVHTYVLKGEPHLMIHKAVHGDDKIEVKLRVESEVNCSGEDDCTFVKVECHGDNCVTTTSEASACEAEVLIETDEADEADEANEADETNEAADDAEAAAMDDDAAEAQTSGEE
ncbi:MAG: hypothetical protein EP340_00120 [Alphaproteobacteria bacterium]|nr:MAG: hypothetical protein EP340_00120 [Alphaproteobacteria bacterium]